jgi:acyl dehydratase
VGSSIEEGLVKTVPAEELGDHIGEELGVSDWIQIDQDRIDAFAEVTLDHQFIHVDPERARGTALGSTVAHGFLTLSLLSHLREGMFFAPENTVMTLNYGLDRLRFVEPVTVGSRVRARSRLAAVTEKAPGRWLIKEETTVEIDGNERPALIAEPLTMFITSG